MATAQQQIWLISPYHTGSHAAWAKGYQQHSHHDVQLLTMAGRFWKWRMQGGAMELASQATAKLQHSGAPDLIITTDMVNLPAWLGLMRMHLPTRIPILHYMHENQLTYPLRAGEKLDLTYATINWLSQLAADCVAFNSHYHRETWFAELPRLLKHFPDYNHLQLIDTVRAKSCVLPVGIECQRIQQAQMAAQHARGATASPSSGKPLIVWNQRWEYDKGPEEFFRYLYRLQALGVAFEVAVAGENFRRVPAEFEEARHRLDREIVHWGYVDSYARYVALLQRADLVVSTALHEFFGISILEAIAAGAFPLLPRRLSYPELIPTELHPACLYRDEEELVALTLHRFQLRRPAPPSLREHLLAHYDWPVVAAQYDELLTRF